MLECTWCKERFSRTPSYIREKLTRRGNKHLFCSTPCYAKHKKATVDRKRMQNMRALQEPQKRLGSTPDCVQCGKQFYTKKHRLLESRGKFCSRPCYEAYRREHPELSVPSAGARPSKVQVMLAQHLGANGYCVEAEVPMLEVGTIADIVLPQHRIVIYVDGEYWHRGREQQDQRITGRLETLGWGVIRIADTEAQKVVKRKADLILPVPPRVVGE